MGTPFDKCWREFRHCSLTGKAVCCYQCKAVRPQYVGARRRRALLVFLIALVTMSLPRAPSPVLNPANGGAAGGAVSGAGPVRRLSGVT